MCGRMIAVVWLAAVVCGCSGGAQTVETASLTGEVKRMSGEPFGNVTVVFYPEQGPTTVTKTDDAGKFTAEVALGTARVAVIAQAEASSTDTSPEATAPSTEKPTIKPQFASPDTSGLTVKVEKELAEKAVIVVE